MERLLTAAHGERPLTVVLSLPVWKRRHGPRALRISRCSAAQLGAGDLVASRVVAMGRRDFSATSGSERPGRLALIGLVLVPLLVGGILAWALATPTAGL